MNRIMMIIVMKMITILILILIKVVKLMVITLKIYSRRASPVVNLYPERDIFTNHTYNIKG